MIVHPSGVVMFGVCEIQTPSCTAKTPSAITAVWEDPARKQVNICRACLQERVRAGEWEIVGARVDPRPDIVIFDAKGARLLVVEIKSAPEVPHAPREWAARVRRNLLVHGAVPTSPFFLLAAWPGTLYLWKEHPGDSTEVPPDFEINVDEEIERRLAKFPEAPTTEYQTAQAVADWLMTIAKTAPETRVDAFRESGLAARLKDAFAKISPIGEV